MFPRNYSDVFICINGQLPMRHSVHTDKAHDFAAERYAHYRSELGDYMGSRRANVATGNWHGVIDMFQNGEIRISE